MFYMKIMAMMMRRTENLPCRSLIFYIAHVILQCLHYLPSSGKKNTVALDISVNYSLGMKECQGFQNCTTYTGNLLLCQTVKTNKTTCQVTFAKQSPCYNTETPFCLARFSNCGKIPVDQGFYCVLAIPYFAE